MIHLSWSIFSGCMCVFVCAGTDGAQVLTGADGVQEAELPGGKEAAGNAEQFT